MGRVKAKRFVYNDTDDRIVQPGKSFFDGAKGHRGSVFFANNAPIVLELACGRGEYSVGLAQVFPDKNFIGVDKKGDRMWIGLQHAHEKGLKNVGFLRTIIHHLDRFFAPQEVAEIWIVHPDPRPKGADERRRLTHPRFLSMYQQLLAPGGLLRLKTDDPDFFAYSLDMLVDQGWKILVQTDDLYTSDLLADHHAIYTHYEQKFVAEGRTIHYCVAQYVGFGSSGV